MNCADFLLVKRIEMLCISKKKYGTSIHILLSLALELLWINGSLLPLVIISCQYCVHYYVHCNSLKLMILHANILYIGTGIYTFKVHGQIYHKLDQLIPGKNDPRHMQLYFYDVDPTGRRTKNIVFRDILQT